jgi:hypothetical protein
MKDKVYGILGLLDLTIVAEIIPNYEVAIPQVFISFTRAVILSTNLLDLLRRSGVPTTRINASPNDPFLLLRC